MGFEFSTKAETLRALSRKLQCAQIAPLVFTTSRDWSASAEAFVDEIISVLGAGPYIVRSSAMSEDHAEQSNAGAYLSLLDISQDQLAEAIHAVFASYGSPEAADQVLVQPMLEHVIYSGVAFSHDPSTCEPYRIINWLDGSDTAGITSGKSGKTWQCAAASPVTAPEALQPVLCLIEELLTLSGGLPVDCEFAVTEGADGPSLWLLQARPLVLANEPGRENRLQALLGNIYSKVVRGMGPHPFVPGKKSVYGVMPDWNPAEIIGIRPKPMALSLYRELITDSIWAYQRHNYGYRNLRSFPLMPHFLGLPYIDVRLSFNSFIPADLDEGIASRLVDYYIDRLLNNPALHDKVEFEIVFSCYSLDLQERLEPLKAVGFSHSDLEEISHSLGKLTNNIINSETGLWRSDAKRIETLAARRTALFQSSADRVERIYWLLEDAKRYGTLPFAGLARAGFVAVQMLRSLVAKGVLTPEDFDDFMRSVDTVSSRLVWDRAALDKSTFLAKYGHLRPGTYDILSPRYDEEPDLYFDWSKNVPKPEVPRPFTLTLEQMRKVAALLKSHKLEIDPVSLFDFIQSCIELREYAKFCFTRNLSDAISLLAECGSEMGFDKEDLAYADSSVFKEMHIASIDAKDALTRSIEKGRADYEMALSISLPPVIRHPEDVWAFQRPTMAPNFVTRKQVTAEVTLGSSRHGLEGKIVCIPNADPGFDWLFSIPIAGLITAWGGANSHMAIRAGEKGLPSIIGAGEELFSTWSSAGRLHIDCVGQRVEVLN